MPEFYQPAHKGDFEIRVTTFLGLEEVLSQELQRLGGRDIKPFTRGVSATGDLGFVYKANLNLHTGLKVLIPIFKFQAGSEQKLYDGAKAFAWEKFMSLDESLMVESVANSEIFKHNLYVSQKIKDAIVDRFREKTGKRPNVDLLHPSLKFYVHIYKEDVTIHLDSSGDPLFLRGYKTEQDLAPMKEVLAAGLVKLSGWERHLPLIDGMCGSGTIAIEAALWANNIPPGYYRGGFGFMRWSNFDSGLYDKIFENSVSRIKNDPVEILANDLDGTVLKKAERNVRNAKVEDCVKCSQSSFFDLKPLRGAGMIILNPPYGERLPVKEIQDLYKQIGDKLKKDFQNHSAWIITSDPDAIKAIGLHASRKIKIYNGPLECRYLKYEMYGGSKKQSKQQGMSGEA
jgi:putative N6-adenine-specific DNA methylase